MTETPRPLPPDIGGELIEYGREILKAGMTFEEWSERAAERLGKRVRPHLQEAWATIHQDATTPPRAKRGLAAVIALVQDHSRALLRSGKRAALWALAVAVVFALGLAWTGGPYTVTTYQVGPKVYIYRINRLTGSVKVTHCLPETLDRIPYVICWKDAESEHPNILP